jgi:hypothetical protein
LEAKAMASVHAGAHQLSRVTASQVGELFATKSDVLHKKVDATRDAYLGFIFPITGADFRSVSEIFGLQYETAQALVKEGTKFSSFAQGNGQRHLTNHIYGASLLALRGKSLDSGLSSVDDKTLERLVKENLQIVLDIAEVRATWFGKIYFPSATFVNAIGVFGGKVSPGAIYELAQAHGFGAVAGQRQTIRGDFGIAVWLMLLGFAP